MKATLAIVMALVVAACMAESDYTVPEENVIPSQQETFVQEDALPPYKMLVHVGSRSKSCYKRAKVHAGCKCPKVVKKTNWANRGVHKNAQDIFRVFSSVRSRTLTVKRVDSAGKDCH